MILMTELSAILERFCFLSPSHSLNANQDLRRLPQLHDADNFYEAQGTKVTNQNQKLRPSPRAE
jgi:hypothetical protein